MSIVRIPYPNSTPTEVQDYVKQNNLIETGFLRVNEPWWFDGSDNIVKGAVFQIGGTVYYTDEDTAITGVTSNYVKLTPSGDGSSCSASYVANLTGVTWNSAYSGYYDVSGNLYIFDELKAMFAGEITSLKSKIWEAINNSNNVKLGEMNIVLTNYTGTGVPKIGAGSWAEINGQLCKIYSDLTITGATVDDTWYDIQLTASNGTFTAQYVARETGVWSDSKFGLYDGNNRVVACVKRVTSTNFINKNILNVTNRTCNIKIHIGDWNMNSSTGGDNSIDVSNGINIARIRHASAMILSDAGGQLVSIDHAAFGDSVSGNIDIRNPFARLWRQLGEFFDNTDYGDTPYNRGYIYICYEV